jgi:hypothetical protein
VVEISGEQVDCDAMRARLVRLWQRRGVGHLQWNRARAKSRHPADAISARSGVGWLIIGYAVPPASTGTFTIVPGNFAGQLPPHAATAVFNVTDVFCHDIAGGSAVSGTVTLASTSGGAYSGSFDLTFDSGDHVTGTFNAAHCAAIETFLTAAGNNTVSCG